jgi:hypothetical protein
MYGFWDYNTVPGMPPFSERRKALSDPAFLSRDVPKIPLQAPKHAEY